MVFSPADGGSGGSYRRQISAEEREFYAQAFATFLQENFRNYAEAARAFFVDRETARRWWNAEGGAPNGLIIGMAFGMQPAAAQRHLALVVDNPEPVRPPAPVLRRVAS